MRKSVAVVVTSCLFSLFLVVPGAQAHSQLVSSFPKENSQLTKAPQYVDLTFNEDLLLIANKVTNKITVTDSKKVNWQKSKLEVKGGKIRAYLKTSLTPGKYTVTYRVVSEDGHPIRGSYSFTYKP